MTTPEAAKLAAECAEKCEAAYHKAYSEAARFCTSCPSLADVAQPIILAALKEVKMECPELTQRAERAEADAAAFREACEWVLTQPEGFDLVSCHADLPNVWQDAGDDIVVASNPGQALLARLSAAEGEISEWKCTRCDMIHPAPKVFTAMCCPKCGNTMGPRNYMERRECELKLSAAESNVSGLMEMMVRECHYGGYLVCLPLREGGYPKATIISQTDELYWFPDKQSAIAAIELALGEQRKEGDSDAK